jgi:hypothetical protein
MPGQIAPLHRALASPAKMRTAATAVSKNSTPRKNDVPERMKANAAPTLADAPPASVPAMPSAVSNATAKVGWPRRSSAPNAPGSTPLRPIA